jgi:hypothetical protein
MSIHDSPYGEEQDQWKQGKLALLHLAYGEVDQSGADRQALGGGKRGEFR